METTIKSKNDTLSVHNQSSKKENYSLFWGNVEFNRFGIISMLILFIGCIGGFAASFGAHGDVLKLAMIVFPTIIALALILAVAPMRLIIYLCSIAIILDLIVLIF
jgi:hypothetical protein